jgi:hypothetical protein
VDVVWVCRNGPNEELRYSIRSVVANMPHNDILVVGGKPDWYTGPFLPVDTYVNNRLSTNKYANTKNNIQHIVDSSKVSDEFVFMNDDFYIMKPLDKLQYYHGGRFDDKLKTFSLYAPTASYTNMLRRTKSVLEGLGIKDPLDYTLHIPVLYHKNKLVQTLPYDGSTRTLYGNIHRVGGRRMNDVKVHPKRKNEWAPEPFDYMNNDTPFLSTCDSVFQSVKNNLLGKVFTKPSKYESDY